MLKNTTSENELKERMHEAIHRKKVGKDIFTADSETWRGKDIYFCKRFPVVVKGLFYYGILAKYTS